jgi:hypothetical protein
MRGTYDFECKKCNARYEEYVEYDPSGKFKGVKCPKCKSARKVKVPSIPVIVGTDTRGEIFENKAGRNMVKAQNERALAESLSHMGMNPYGGAGDSAAIHDANTFGEGLHDPEFRPGLT